MIEGCFFRSFVSLSRCFESASIHYVASFRSSATKRIVDPSKDVASVIFHDDLDFCPVDVNKTLSLVVIRLSGRPLVTYKHSGRTKCAQTFPNLEECRVTWKKRNRWAKEVPSKNKSASSHPLLFTSAIFILRARVTKASNRKTHTATTRVKKRHLVFLAPAHPSSRCTFASFFFSFFPCSACFFTPSGEY